MLNNSRVNVIEKSTFTDEFAPANSNFYEEDVNESQNAVDFNSRIADNFDKIIHYDTYSKTEEVKEFNTTYEKFTSNASVDVNPSSTTMQFRGLNRAEIYKDYRESENSYIESSVSKPKIKLFGLAITIVSCVFAVFTVFNATLIKNMNALIAEKSSQVEELTNQKKVLDEVYMQVTSEDSIIDSAVNGGMTK